MRCLGFLSLFLLFAIIWDANTQKLCGLNASGRSPFSLTLAHFKERGFECVPARAGHRVQVNVGDFGGYQAIRVDARNRVYYGASEARKDGHAAGY